MDNLNALVVFARVAETRSFTAAAERLCLTPSAVSKAVSRLERELGVRLLIRSTRAVRLTGDGITFFEHCRQILAAVEEAEHSVTLSKGTPHGRLRLQMPVGFGRRVVVPALGNLARKYPGIVIDAELSDRVADLAFEGFDAAIQIGEVSDDRLVARTLCRLRFTALASPEYLERYGEPAMPEDLKRHECLAYVAPLTGGYRPWEFRNEGQVSTLRVSGRLNVNNADSLLEAAIAGMGIVMISNFIAAEAISTGKLKPVLTNYIVPGPKVYIVYPPSRTVSLKLRTVISYLEDAVAGEELVFEDRS